MTAEKQLYCWHFCWGGWQEKKRALLGSESAWSPLNLLWGHLPIPLAPEAPPGLCWLPGSWQVGGEKGREAQPSPYSLGSTHGCLGWRGLGRPFSKTVCKKTDGKS